MPPRDPPCILKRICSVGMKRSLVFRGGIRTEKSTLASTMAGPFVSLCLSCPSPSPFLGTGTDHPCSVSPREGAFFMWLETHEGSAWAPSPHTDALPKPPAKPSAAKALLVQQLISSLDSLGSQ